MPLVLVLGVARNVSLLSKYSATAAPRRALEPAIERVTQQFALVRIL